MDELIERLAAFAHQRWSGWMEWQDDHFQDVTLEGETFLDRWHRQMETAYADLPEDEKDSDREEARAWLEAIGYAVLESERDALRAELAALREQCRWIPVGERLPLFDHEVELIVRAKLHGDHWWLGREYAFNRRHGMAWRKLPAPPEEVS